MSYPPSPPPGKQKLRGGTPRKLGWIFLVVAVALFAVGGVVIAKKSLSAVDNFQRIPVSDGGGSVKINDTGKWVLYYEANNAKDLSTIPYTAMITDSAGARVTVKPFGGESDKAEKFTYDYNSHEGATTYEFNATSKGTYRVVFEASSDVPTDADIAVGRDITTGTIVGALLIVGGVLFLIATIVLLIVGYVKRSRHKKELAQYGGGYYPPPGGYGPPPGGGYGPPPGGGYGPPPGYNPPPSYGGQTG